MPAEPLPAPEEDGVLDEDDGLGEDDVLGDDDGLEDDDGVVPLPLAEVEDPEGPVVDDPDPAVPVLPGLVPLV